MILENQSQLCSAMKNICPCIQEENIVESTSANNLLSSLLESGNVILLEDNQQVVEITAEQAQQLGISQAN